MDSTTDATTRISIDKADPTGPSPIGPDPAGPVIAEGGVFAEGSLSPDPAPAPQPEVRAKFRLRRSRTDCMLGGVCGGLAESTGVDATVLRIALVALTVLGFGTGVVVYAAVWLLAPEDDTP